MTSSPVQGAKDGSSDNPSDESRPCVLFVDDEDAVRRLGARALKGAGFEVLLAADGVEAIECFQAQHTRISVVVIDVTMPRMTGTAAAEAMRNISPSVPVVLSTGFACDETSHGIPGVAATLQKPYRIHTLVETIREVLSRR